MIIPFTEEKGIQSQPNSPQHYRDTKFSQFTFDDSSVPEPESVSTISRLVLLKEQVDLAADLSTPVHIGNSNTIKKRQQLDGDSNSTYTPPTIPFSTVVLTSSLTSMTSSTPTFSATNPLDSFPIPTEPVSSNPIGNQTQVLSPLSIFSTTGIVAMAGFVVLFILHRFFKRQKLNSEASQDNERVKKERASKSLQRKKATDAAAKLNPNLKNMKNVITESNKKLLEAFDGSLVSLRPKIVDMNCENFNLESSEETLNVSAEKETTIVETIPHSQQVQSLEDIFGLIRNVDTGTPLNNEKIDLDSLEMKEISHSAVQIETSTAVVSSTSDITTSKTKTTDCTDEMRLNFSFNHVQITALSYEIETPISQDDVASNSFTSSSPVSSQNALNKTTIRTFASIPSSDDQLKDETSSTKPRILSSSIPYSPSFDPRKPILVLDLDETLIHSNAVARRKSDFSITVTLNGESLGDPVQEVFHVFKRPHVEIFLNCVKEWYNVVVFTAGIKEYASQILDRLDPNGEIFLGRYYRDSCMDCNGIFVKDLTSITPQIERIFLVDNTPACFSLQPTNGIPIKSWFQDPNDCELLRLLDFLKEVKKVDDVRSILGAWKV